MYPAASKKSSASVLHSHHSSGVPSSKTGSFTEYDSFFSGIRVQWNVEGFGVGVLLLIGVGLGLFLAWPLEGNWWLPELFEGLPLFPFPLLGVVSQCGQGGWHGDSVWAL